MSSLKIKKQLSLLVFLPILFVSSYSNTYNTSMLPIMYVTSFITEIDLERVGVIKQISGTNKTVKKFVSNLISKFLKTTQVRFNKLEYIETFKKTIVGNKAVVLNRGSPVFN